MKGRLFFLTACSVACCCEGFLPSAARPHLLVNKKAPRTCSKVRNLCMANPNLQTSTTESKYARRFSEMISRLASYSESQRAAVQDTRMRSVLNGVIDGIGDRDVELAFRVLYEDFGPIRFAGDIMFKYLDGTVTREGQALKGMLEKRAVFMSESDIVITRELFSLVDADGSGDLDRQEMKELMQGLQDVGIALPFGDNVESFMDTLDYDGNGLVAFDEFCSGLGKILTPEVDAAEKEGYVQLLKSKWGRDSAPTIDSQPDVKYVKRYTNMLTTIQGWEATLADSWLKKDSSGQGRMQAVLSGCIAGSRRPAVVEALRIVYCDFPPVRMAGDLIFSLMTKLMSKKNK